MKKLLNILILFTVYCLLFTNFASAESMRSDSYEIEMGNFNMTGGGKSSPGYKLLDSVGQTAPGKYESSGHIIKAGFVYIKSIIPFGFSISDLTADFGTLSPNIPATQSATLTVSAGGAGGYRVTAFENHPLRIINGTTAIPDATCNDGACTQSAAGIWDLNWKYGFGFNMSGSDVPADFISSKYYRHFSDQSLNETSQEVMGSNNVGRNRTATVTYTVKISAIQAAGDYDNFINYIATPGF